MSRETSRHKEDRAEKYLLEQVDPERREEAKKLLRLNKYKGSALYYIVWHLNLFLLSLALILFYSFAFPFLSPLKTFLFEDDILSLLVFSFFHTVILSFFTKEIFFRLNQKGVHVINAFLGFCILMYIIIGTAFYVKSS